MHEKPRDEGKAARNNQPTRAEETSVTRQSQVTVVQPLDLPAARRAVAEVVAAELQSEVISADVLNFRMK